MRIEYKRQETINGWVSITGSSLYLEPITYRSPDCTKDCKPLKPCDSCQNIMECIKNMFTVKLDVLKSMDATYRRDYTYHA